MIDVRTSSGTAVGNWRSLLCRHLRRRGYANTSLRDIANDSDFTHGVLHYYFADKNELMIFVVREYKVECVTRYDTAVEAATSAADLAVRFAAALKDTVIVDASMHRLWYDMRAQSLFDERFRSVVGEIEQGLEDMTWRVVTRYGELAQAAPGAAAATGLCADRRFVPAGAVPVAGRRRFCRGLPGRTGERRDGQSSSPRGWSWSRGSA